jgi:hypothetical protein
VVEGGGCRRGGRGGWLERGGRGVEEAADGWKIEIRERRENP